MGASTAFAVWRTQFGFVILLLLLVFFPASDCRKRSALTHSTFVLPRNYNTWRSDPRRCPLSAAGSKQLKGGGVQLAIGHAYGSCSPSRSANSSWTDALSQMLQQDEARAQAKRWRLARNISAAARPELVDAPIHSGWPTSSLFLAKIGFGTPPQNLSLGVDTDSHLTWVQCKPCRDCYSQEDPIFEPGVSSSYKPVACDAEECFLLSTATHYRPPCSKRCRFETAYASGQVSKGDLGFETLRPGSDSVRKFAFGCGRTNLGFSRAAGLLGLGLQELSFPSQTAAKYKRLFSYCVPDYENPDGLGTLSFGVSAVPLQGAFTTLVHNPSAPYSYCVVLSGIGVAGRMLDIPPGVFEPGPNGKGTVVDSGTLITRLVDAAYDPLRKAFAEELSMLSPAPAQGILDTCFQMPRGRRRISVPIVTLHFRDGAQVDLTASGLLLHTTRDGSVACLAFSRTPDAMNILGGFQQQRFIVSYDVGQGNIGFTPTICRPP